MFVSLAIIISAMLSVVVGFSVQQLTYAQANMTGENLTVSSSNMTATGTSTTTAVPTPEVLMQKLNNALDDVLGKVRQQDPDAYLSKVECTIDSSWNVQCTVSWRPAKGGQVSATNLNSSKSNVY
jgi:uncharacterized protein YoxC